MPNQSDPNSLNNNQPLGNTTTPSVVEPVIPDFQIQSDPTDLPPMPNPVSTTPEVKQEVSPIQSDSGSAAPMETSNIVTSPKKKFGGGKIIATILGIFMLVGGVAGGVLLTQQQQDIREKAGGDQYREEMACDTDSDGQPDKWCLISNANCPDDTGAPVNCLNVTWDQGSNCDPVTEPCSNHGGDGGGSGGFRCENVAAYSSSWAELSPAQLATLKSGDTVNFCAVGKVVQNLVPITAARFTINNVQRPPTTAKRPGGAANEFCDTYTLQPDITTYNVSAQVQALNQWK